MRLVFDIETNGLLDTVSTVHCINLIDRETRKSYSFNHGVYADGSPAPRDGSVEDGLKLLEDADWIGGHNIIGYDIPALQIVYPGFKPKGTVFDTLVCSQVIWTDLADRDFAAIRKRKLPPEYQNQGLIGKHSLEAWGYRLGEFKGEFDPANYINPETGEPHTWATIGFTPEMDEYGRQDPVVTLKLVEHVEAKQYPRECIDLEHAVKRIISRQERWGFRFNETKAMELVASLMARRATLDSQLREVFEPWYAPDGPNRGHFVPKRDNKKMGYVAGAAATKVKLVQFNPGSRDHIADRLTKLYGWKPVEFTDGGKPKVDETTLDGLVFPEAKLLKEFLTVEKRLGQISDGKQAWLAKVRNGRIHGRVNCNGAVTGRMTHFDPNVAQVPAVRKGKGDVILLGYEGGWGYESRELFEASPGFVLVGCDAEGLELRCLAHFMARYDGGAYAEAVINGKRENGSDVHTLNQKLAGLSKRDSAKTLVYAFLYGAGDYKLGTIAVDDMSDAVRDAFCAQHAAGPPRDAAIAQLGKRLRARFLKGLPALGRLIDAVKDAAKSRGFLRGLDGRLLHIRSAHAALNTLLQSAGAIVMKRALQLFDQSITEGDYGTVHYVAQIHDEAQLEAEVERAQEVGQLYADCIRRAGESFNFRCVLSGSFAVGPNWAHTH